MSKVTGEVVREFGPWLVVRRSGQPPQAQAYAVVDRTAKPPTQVHGPTTKADAERYARINQNLWIAVHGQGEWT